MKQTSLYDHLLRYPRSSEESQTVISSWGAPIDCYLTTTVHTTEKSKAVADYYALSAERLLYRSKVLSLPIDEGFAASNAMQCAHPFGQNGPDFASLYAPSVSIAMAFVPLTPEGGGGKPVLARLYCVKGLASSYPPPFADGADLSALASYSWFVAGLPDKLADEPINGRSWLLAANLLIQVVGKNATASTMKNLSTSFIVSGDVVNGDICPVEMGRKPELATIKEYHSLKWIIPMKNSNDMNTVSSRLVEKPATLEEAYELIESMQSRATKSFFSYLKLEKPDLDGIKQLVAIGVDLFSEDEDTGKAPLQLVAESIAEAERLPADKAKLGAKSERQMRLDKLVPIRDWLKGQCADCAMTIYILAKTRILNALDSFLEKFPVNARDERGLTAVDWAIIAGDWETANLIHSLGGVCDKQAKNNTALKAIVDGIDTPWIKDQNGECLGVPIKIREKVKSALKCGLEADTGELFSKFLKIGDLEVVELALQLGRSPDNLLAPLDFGESNIPILAIAEDKAELLDEETQKALIDLLLKYGATMNSDIEQRERHALARCYVNKTRKSSNVDTKRIGKFLEDGILSVDEMLKMGHAYPPKALHSYCEYTVWGNLFTIALYRGWIEVVKKCLEKGASPTSDLKITYFDDYPSDDGGFETTQCVLMNRTPLDLVKESESVPSETKSYLVALLESYSSKEQTTTSNPS